jgi:hypothetical protein
MIEAKSPARGGTPGLCAQARILLQRLQFLARLKPDSFAGRNGHLGSGSGVPPDPRLSGPNIKDPETAQLDPVAIAQGFFHRLKDRFDSHFRFCFRNACAIHDLIDDV